MLCDCLITASTFYDSFMAISQRVFVYFSTYFIDQVCIDAKYAVIQT